jgi:hypothetical protein
MDETVGGELEWASETPTSMRRFVPDVSWEMVTLVLVVVPVDVSSTAIAASALLGIMKEKQAKRSVNAMQVLTAAFLDSIKLIASCMKAGPTSMNLPIRGMSLNAGALIPAVAGPDFRLKSFYRYPCPCRGFVLKGIEHRIRFLSLEIEL